VISGQYRQYIARSEAKEVALELTKERNEAAWAGEGIEAEEPSVIHPNNLGRLGSCRRSEDARLSWSEPSCVHKWSVAVPWLGIGYGSRVPMGGRKYAEAVT
jgi:hypothetical protein